MYRNRAGRDPRNRHQVRSFLTVVVTLGATGCATSPPLPPLPGSPCLASGPRNEFVSGEELDELQGSNLYEVLERARPLWMITAGSRAHSVRVGTETAVVANGQYIGGLGSLRSLPSKGVHSIRRLRGTEAANGIAGFLSVQHLDAAILVSFGCSAV